VRLNIIGKLNQVATVIGLEKLSVHLLPAIMELAEDRQWRVRMAIITYIPLLAEQLGEKFFNEKLSELCLAWLGDVVYSIREAATANLKRLAQVFGVAWARSHILPKVLELQRHSNYLYRLTTVFAVHTLCTVVPPDVVATEMLPLLIQLSADHVANIRFNVAKALKEVVAVVDKGQVDAKVKTALQTLGQDKDREVRYFAHLVLLSISSKA